MMSPDFTQTSDLRVDGDLGVGRVADDDDPVLGVLVPGHAAGGHRVLALGHRHGAASDDRLRRRRKPTAQRRARAS